MVIKMMSDEGQNKMKELLRNKIRSKEYGEQSIELAEREIARLCEELDIDESISQVACAIYRRSLNEKFIENRTIGMVAAASVYTACRVEDIPIPVTDVSELAVDPQAERVGKEAVLKRVYSEISSSLSLNVGIIDPKDLTARISNQLDLSDKCINKANELLDNVGFEVINGKYPRSLAAAAVYAAGLLENEKRTQEEVAEVANVSATTIRIRYQTIVEVYAEEEELV